MTPFEQWFSSDFGILLRDIPAEQGLLSSGFTINHASWDRKAAYLLWDLMGRPDAHWVQQTAHLYGRRPEEIEDLLADTPPPPTAADEDPLAIYEACLACNEEIEDLLA